MLPGDVLAYAALDAPAVLARLECPAGGLTADEAARRLASTGPNEVAREKARPPVVRLFQAFVSPLPLLLLVLAALSAAVGEVNGAVVIGVILVLSVLLSFFHELRAGNAAERLRAMVHVTATAIREGTSREVPLAALVPGDLVRLSAGDMIPADLRVLSARDLFVNQAALTGESMPVAKTAAAAAAACTRAPDLDNTCFMGTNVVSGTASGIVVATGGKTYFGSIATALAAPRELTSFDVGVSRYIALMLRFMFVMVPLVFVLNGLARGNWLEAFMFALAVAVGLAPEMLPVIVTVNLAKGAIAMSERKVIVKRLNAIQNLGAMDVLCTDKTGTLTQDRVLLKRHLDVSGAESERVLEYAYLNSYHQSGLRNLLDAAVLEHHDVHAALDAAGRYRKVDEIPFDFQRRRMSVVLEKDGARTLLICKGAIEEVLAACTHVEEEGRVVDIEPGHIGELTPAIKELNEDGFRVIAVAYKEVDARSSAFGIADEAGLVLCGYIAFQDPPKESAAEAIRLLAAHGVTVKVLTGDNDAVSRKVCRDVGLTVEGVLLGREIDAMDDTALSDAVSRTTVFAKLTPHQKVRVLQSLRSGGCVVGFLGDGINDGPALKAADVGISVDTASDIARDSADIILLDKSLLVLDEGVTEGRKVFGNIMKYIKMGSSSNFGNMLSVTGASLALPFLPMAPVQILLNNLLYDLSQTAIATDGVDEEYIAKPRKWEIGNVGRYMLCIGPVSSLFDYVTFVTLWFAFDAAGDGALFQTGWFVESLLSQTLVVHVIRTGRLPFVESRASLPLIVTTAAICFIGVWLPFSPFAGALGFTPLPAAYFGALVLILAAYLVATQCVKAWLVRRFGLG